MVRNVARAVDFGPPRGISDESFELICRTNAISADHRAATRARLDEITTAFAKAISDQSARPRRADDRVAFQRMVKSLHEARDCLRRLLGPAGQHGLRVAGRRIAPVITVGWIRKHFGNDRAVPNAIVWPPGADGRDDLRSPLRPIDAEDLSLAQRIVFAEYRAADIFVAMIADIAEALDSGRRAIVQLPRGRNPLESRTYLLAALAELWYGLGRRPTMGLNSKFGAFSETVFEAIGWPTDEVISALPDAIADWRRLYRR